MSSSATYVMTSKIGATGFATVTMDDLNQIITELNLKTIAGEQAAKIAPGISHLIDRVVLNAPNRALVQAMKNLLLPEAAGQLPSFLKHFTRLWAIRYAQNAAKGKPVPEIDLQQALLSLSAPALEALVESATEVELPVAPTEASEEAKDRKKTADLNLDCFEQVLRDHEFVYTREDDSVRLKIRCGNVMADLLVRTRSTCILLMTTLPVLVPKDHRPGVSAGIQFANWKLSLGNFEFHEKSGTVRFRNSAPLAAIPCPTQLAGLLFSSLFALRQYALGLLQLALGDGDPVSVMNHSATPADNDCAA